MTDNKHNTQFKAWALGNAIEVAKLNKDGATVEDVLANAKAIADFGYVELTAEEQFIVDRAKELEIKENAVALDEKAQEIKNREETAAINKKRQRTAAEMSVTDWANLGKEEKEELMK